MHWVLMLLFLLSLGVPAGDVEARSRCRECKCKALDFKCWDRARDGRLCEDQWDDRCLDHTPKRLNRRYRPQVQTTQDQDATILFGAAPGWVRALNTNFVVYREACPENSKLLYSGGVYMKSVDQATLPFCWIRSPQPDGDFVEIGPCAVCY